MSLSNVLQRAFAIGALGEIGLIEEARLVNEVGDRANIRIAALGKISIQEVLALAGRTRRTEVTQRKHLRHH
jgi:hypothetical protein